MAYIGNGVQVTYVEANAVGSSQVIDYTITSSDLSNTGVVAGTYGNTTAIPVVVIDQAGRVTSATTSTANVVTSTTWTAANSTVTIATPSSSFNTTLTAANDTVQGLVKVLDSVANTSTVVAASANSAKNAYDRAIDANTRASSAQTAATSAYSNAVATAATDASTKAATAYSNAVAYAAANTYVNTTFAPKASPTFTGTATFADVTISGNLTASGTTTYINTTTLNVGDNIITLNADVGAIAPTENAGIEINRGSSANVQFVWDETNDRWAITNTYVTGSLTTTGAGSIGTTLAAGNTTITGFANVSTLVKSSYAVATGSLAAYDSATGGIYTYYSSGGVLGSYANNTGGQSTLSLDGSVVQIRPSGTTTIYAAANGNVGVGTSTPSVKLDVNGDLGVSANPGGNRWIITSGATNTYTGQLMLQAGAGSAGYGGGLVLYGHSHASTPGWVKAGISSGSGGKFSVNTWGTGGGTDVFTVDSSGSTVHTGAVSGITTLAAGNTTITGFANVTSSVSVGYNSASSLVNSTFNTALTTLGGLHFINGAGTSGAGKEAAITFMGDTATQSQAGIYVHNNSTEGTHMAFATTDNYTTGPQIGLRIMNSGYSYFPRSYVEAAGSFRAPYFYDSNNTAYYVDPASTSVLSSVRIGDGTSPLLSEERNQNLKITGGSSTDVGITMYNSAGTWCAQLYAANGTDYGFLNANWGGWDIQKTINGSLYLNNNTTYYLNPASTTKLYGLQVWHGSTGYYSSFQGGNEFNIYTAAGAASRMYINWNSGDVSLAGTTLVAAGGYVTANSSVRTPVVYDSDNTSYYIDLANSTTSIICAGKVGIGNTAPTDKLRVEGSFSAITKSFLIDHPTKPGQTLRHGSLEGPENGVYVRGRLLNSNVIELPDYWTELVDADTITVQLTSIGKHQDLYVVDIANNRIVVGNSNLFSRSIECFYTVFAERKDVDKLVVES